MKILDTDFRWMGIWRFLSLDDAAAFFEQLLVPAQPAELSNGLKGVFQEWVNDPDFYLSNGATVSYKCFRWFEETFGPEQVELLIGWGNDVYVSGGADRSAQWTWSLLAASAVNKQRKQPALDPWVNDFFERLRSKALELWPPFGEGLEWRFEAPISDWDRAALALDDSSRENIETTLDLTISHNSFAYAWEWAAKDMPLEQLERLYEIAKHLAVQYQSSPERLVFPGAWRFFLLPFLSRAPSSWAVSSYPPKQHES